MEPITQRIQLIEALGRLLPHLEGKVYPADHMDLKEVHTRLTANPGDSEYARSHVSPIARSLAGIIQTDEKYQASPEGRALLERAKGLLDDIMETYQG
ncbi:hypothetical protein HYX07_03370 [Candidatus Woesearchaeota archaeon]|nr:hypothetical protein [Candidatus Woesearchaeota archaeon]